MVVNFMGDSENIVDEINSYAAGKPILLIFGDLIGSSSLESIANMYTVEARHMTMSMVFLIQKVFVNCEQYRKKSPAQLGTAQMGFDLN